ncbi:hypothetical protein HYDPIDRAFT_55452, partial [Hydnomerulius pinastri MD-312]
QPTFSSLFCTNFSPSDDQSLGIKSLIKKQEHQLSNIKDEVERLKKSLTEMERCQAEAEGLLMNLHATLSPIKRMPPEIMSEIFERCLLPKDCPDWVFKGRSDEAPLLLGRVCSSWRRISRATPQLWRDIHLNICDGRYSDELRIDTLPVLQTWLKHSGALPLNLAI